MEKLEALVIDISKLPKKPDFTAENFQITPHFHGNVRLSLDYTDKNAIIRSLTIQGCETLSYEEARERLKNYDAAFLIGLFPTVEDHYADFDEIHARFKEIEEAIPGDGWYN